MPTPSNTENSIQVALKASSGKFVSLKSGTNTLQAIESSLDSAEKFQFTQDENSVITLKSSGNKYVTVSGTGTPVLLASADTITENEKFQMDTSTGDPLSFKASNNNYVELSESDNFLQATAANVDDSASFDIIPISEDTGTSSQITSVPLNSNPSSVFTVCFCGTACTRDEGEVTRPGSDKSIYCNETGYIPVRINKEISGSLTSTTPSITVRGVGVNDWANSGQTSEPLKFDGPLNAEKSLLKYVKKYSGGNQASKITEADGWSAPALALHGANLAAESGLEQFNFIGHSRGAVECIMAAWFIYAYGSADLKKIPINIFAIDPVPGTGKWYGLITQLPPNVLNYVGVYAWDVCGRPEDIGFQALIPRPNGLMTGTNNPVKIKSSSWPWSTWNWMYIADDAQLANPLTPGTDAQPTGYHLYACRGRHGTVAGNYTADGKYNPDNVSPNVAPVPELIYKMARGYLTKWGTVFQTASQADQRVLDLRRKINTNHREFDAMGGGETRTSDLPNRPYVRRVSSIDGRNPFDSYYMDNVVGDPPYKMAYPVTAERKDAGWVKWKFL